MCPWMISTFESTTMRCSSNSRRRTVSVRWRGGQDSRRGAEALDVLPPIHARVGVGGEEPVAVGEQVEVAVTALEQAGRPEEAIALRPARPRDSARLLHVRPEGVWDGGFDDLIVSDAPSLFRPGDLLVFNDTRVIPARVQCHASTRSPAFGWSASLTISQAVPRSGTPL